MREAVAAPAASGTALKMGVASALVAAAAFPVLRHYGISAANAIIESLLFVAAAVFLGSRIEEDT